MTDIPKSYKKHIAEGKGILVFSIFFAVISRILYYYLSSPDKFDTSTSLSGFLWHPLEPVFQNHFYSLIASSIITALMAFLSAQINTSHLLIRRRSALPPALILLLFSCHPSVIVMSQDYIAALFMLMILHLLFSSYGMEPKQYNAFKVSFYITLGSMFSPVLLLYIPFVWIGLYTMRCFNFKSWLAFLLGFVILYIPAFSFFLFTNNLKAFYHSFSSIGMQSLSQLTILNFGTLSWITLGFTILLMSAIIGNSYINRHKDKIKVRAYISLLNLFTIASITYYLILSISPRTNLYIALSCAAFMLSHYYALAERKGTVVLYYISFILFLINCLSNIIQY